MKHLKQLAMVFLTIATCLYGQMAISPGRRTGAVAVNTVSTTNLGNTVFTSDSAETGNRNVMQGVYFVPSRAETVLSASILIDVGTNTSGSKIDLGLYTYAATNKFGTALCHATYTAPSKNLTAQTVTVSLSGCGTLASGTPYLVIVNTNDNEFNFQYYECGGSCSGALGTSTSPSIYANETYGTYGSNVAAALDTQNITVYVTVTP